MIEGMRFATIDLPEPGGTNHQEIVASGHGHLDRAAQRVLTFDFAEVRGRVGVGRVRR
jgi:hypothetical protein